ncbi:adhesion G protein-coupled receptor F5-like [Lithobates pipiens]
MRHKMRFVWIFILTLMMGRVTPTDGTLESWGVPQLLSLLGHQDHGLESDTIQHRSLSRHRRDVSNDYILDVEISIPDPSMAIQIKQYLANNLTFPLALGTGDTNITSIKVTTACNQTGSVVQCSCERGYMWSSDVCAMYAPCSGVSDCSCIKSSTFPTQFCQPQTVATKMSLTILKEFTADFLNTTSSAYQDCKNILESSFNKSYQSLPGFQSAKLNGFRPGSIVADYTVVSEPTTTDVLSTANSNLKTELATTAYGVDSITQRVEGWSNITVSPNNIFINDSVTLICSVNVTTYSNVSWYFNGTQKIENDSNWSYTTTTFAYGIQSILTIRKSSLNNSGNYQCNIVWSSFTYTAVSTIQINTLDLTPLNSVVTCNNMKVEVIQCCTKGGNVTFNLTCQKTSGNIAGISESSSTCQSYTITADPQLCASTQTSDFRCACISTNGAVLTQDITVNYKASYEVNVTGSSYSISEGSTLTLTCECSITNVQNMAWYFLGNDNVNSSIDPKYQTTATTCNSVLTIPSNSMSVNWNGTFICMVNGVYPGNRTIAVYRKAKPSQIIISPISRGFTCGSAVNFSCCVDYIDAYQSSGTKINIAGNSIPMTRSGDCFTVQQTLSDPYCKNLEANCTITNLLGDTVKSEAMVLNYTQNPACKDPIPGLSINVGTAQDGQTITVSCQQIDPTLDGTRTYICTATKWVQTSDNCVSKALNSLNNQVADLITSPNPNQQVPSIVAMLNNTVSQNQDITNSPANIQLVVSILQQVGSVVTSVPAMVMQDFLNSVSIVVDNSTTATWNKVQNKVNESSTLLNSVESFATKLEFNDTRINITKKNVQLIGSVASRLSNNYDASFDFNDVNNLTGNIVINKTILDKIPNNTRVVSVAYATLKDILGDPQSSTSNSTVNGLVMTTVLSSNYSEFKIGMDFKISNSSLTNASCVWWNFKKQDWDNSGCQLRSLTTNDTVHCICDHLTSFSILMSTSDLSPEAEIILSYITYIGVGISMLSLVVCIIIEAMIWKSVTKNKTSYLRHVCIMNIAVTLLMADIWFIIGAAMNTTNTFKACVAATFFAHLFYLCVFFWMLTMGLILFYRLMCVFHDLSKTTMMGISFFLGYGCPVIIAVITVAVTQSQNTYLHPTKCWLNIIESKAFLAFVLPALTILLVNFITLLVVIIKVLRPSVGDKPKKEEKSTLNHITKCILILTPLLGLTWGFGIGTMSSSSVVIHGIFAVLNSLQGLFILLFGCLMDKKVRDALFSRFSISRWTSQQTKTSNLSSTDPVAAKKGINLFAKKGVYNISSAQVNSSEMASNSYSLLS